MSEFIYLNIFRVYLFIYLFIYLFFFLLLFFFLWLNFLYILNNRVFVMDSVVNRLSHINENAINKLPQVEYNTQFDKFSTVNESSCYPSRPLVQRSN